jgi:(1->4)-alpha-D-glucan 1-alpha-D-glucosylmutase
MDWRAGSREINYRRFFDINDLIGIRIEDEKVFDWYHGKILSLMKKHPEIQGLRVDHVDGLTFPAHYLKRLSKKCSNVWVEKILGEKESLPSYWPVQGSTGYEFSNTSARLFVDLQGLLYLHSHYLKNIDDRWERFHDCVYESKREMLESHFSAELAYITDAFYTISQTSKKYKNKFTRRELSTVIMEVSSSLRVYRTYAQKGKPIKSVYLAEALAEAEGRGKMPNRNAFRWFREVLAMPGTWGKDLYVSIKRWEQLTGPVMAKGLEDTALYRYCPLLSLNGVGGEPDWIGDGSREYHSAQQEVLRTFPLSLTTTSTHDTKRSEDVRSRIHVVAELSEEWTELFEKLIQDLQIASAPSPRVVYFIFETIIGAWPLDGKVSKEFVTRIQNYFVKAMREAKTETSWSDVNHDYEKQLREFVDELLVPGNPEGRDFLKRIRDFADKAAYFGALYSLSQVVLKGTSPGVADFYQGCEMWDLSLVDPDNRRPVDYSLRQSSLRKIQEGPRKELLTDVLNHWRSGEVKQLLTWILLQMRRASPDLILKGEYIPVEGQGSRRSHFVSYLRKYKDEYLWVVIPRFLAKIGDAHSEELRLKNEELLQTQFQLPSNAPTQWINLVTEEKLQGHGFKAEEIFKNFPMAVYRGVLNPVTHET